ncbi:hypothetical protein [Pseudoalteromonas luteoviolacea]|uniref:Uncharacterized protein n=1 Tax=Pseudoalteromonas luteoviolacea (strain 2ta16) TaxID=1353533 RepID=V4H5G8_PSEL2|nr:hypothetical protein [Pseudoalteromonas luteoviolacea]ESP92736.1 hypothetical protein PL2TA16_03934 [Pseudoalteromonas luteoviolacea 2ta16]KZN35546.1 hypothetical protein N483_00910 [Pseudoalteromonas luteoviolacea NCIMB 1944]
MFDIYSIVDHVFPLVVAIGLILSWKVATARWFMISYSAIVVTNLLTMHLTIQWNTHYYLFDALVSIAFLIPIIYRRDLALFLYNMTGNEFYRCVYRKQALSAQECMIVLVVIILVAVNLITWLEVLSYKYYWIDNAFIKLYLRDNIVLLLQIILCGCFLTYANKAESRELNYENT